MKSVKNFFERINSIDHSDNSSNSGGGGSSKKQQLEKLKCNSNSSTAGNENTNDANTNPTPTSMPTSTTDPSPTPSIMTSTPINETIDETPVGVGDNATVAVERSPTSGGSPTNNVSPFNFTPAPGVGTHVPSSLSAPAIKPQKSRRKISLPWFRQSSVSSHAKLSRQFTIDSPASFRLFRQPSNNYKVGTQEATWVVSDYIAAPGSNELSVTKGQQVEIIEPPTVAEPDFCLVRLNPQNDDAAVQEGIVPVSILKPPPNMQKANSSRKDNNDTIQEQSNNRGKPDPLTSSTKRRGFSGRKWLPQPLRKLSQSKVEKPPTEKSLIKKTSEKSLRLPQKHAEHEDETATSGLHSTTTSYGVTSQHATSSSHHNTSQQDFEAEEEAGLELPPPMKPIQEPHLIANGPPAFSKDLKEIPANTGKMDGNPALDLNEIVQIVKEKTEQHEEKSKFLKPSYDMNNTSCSSETNGRGISGELDLCYANNVNNVADNNDENNTESINAEAALNKRRCALDELISTEELYIQDLSDIVNGYIAEIRNSNSDIPLPEDLKGGKERMVFGNIEAIYEWHRDYFLKALKRCQKAPAELGAMIKRYERKFNMYTVYCQNKPVSEHIVNEHTLYFDQIREKLRHRLVLGDLLIKPVQRITKYELLLKEITKQTKRAGLFDEVASMEESYQVMKIVCKAVNDTMVLRRLEKFEGKITAQGKLLLQGTLNCIEDAKNSDRSASMIQKPRELQVFLLEQSIIFSDINTHKKTQFSSPTYTYRSHIQVNKMQLEELPNNRFLLKSTDPNRPDLNMICSAAKVESNREWLETIRNILQSQHDFLKAITSPIQYQKELTKDA